MSARAHAERTVYRVVPAVLAALLLAVASLPAAAGDAWWCNRPYDPAHPLAWENVRADATALVDAGRFADAYESVWQRYRAEAAALALPGAAASDITATARATLDAYLRALAEAGRENPQIWRGTEIPGQGRLVYELGPLFDGDAARALTIPCDVFDPGAGDSVGELTAYLFRALYRVGNYGDLVYGQAAAAAMASRTYTSYHDMVFNGLPMWPWELWANGWFVPDRFTAPPPRTQLVLLRPGVAPALRFDGDKNSAMDLALLLEPVGFVRYASDDYREWWGGSLLVTLTQDNGVGYGAQLRWNEFTVGVAHHRKPDDDLLYVSVDLYRLILGDDRRTGSADVFLEGVRERLESRLAP